MTDSQRIARISAIPNGKWVVYMEGAPYTIREFANECFFNYLNKAAHFFWASSKYGYEPSKTR